MTKILVKDKYSSRAHTTTVAGYIEGALDDAYSSGQVEGIDDRLRATTKFLASLSQLLFEKGVITLEEIREIAPMGSIQTLEVVDG